MNKKLSFHDNWTYEGRQITLPHDAMLESRRDADAPCKGAGAFFTGGHYIYEKNFQVLTEDVKKHYTFYFEGVYKNAEVYLNDQKIGQGGYGYLPFTACADGALQEGENHLRVEADTKDQPDSRWYSGGGIYRPVWLYIQDDVKIEINGIKIRTLSIAPPKISVRTEHQGGEVQVEILDQEGNVLETQKGDDLTFTLDGAKLWDAKNPNLYTARVKLLDAGKIKEERKVPFGIRQISWSAKGLFINGKNTKLKGGCLHHDNGVIGAREFEESAFRRIRILKEYGFNAIRSAHNPCSEAVLKACDELGMYIMDESWDMWYRKKSPYDYANQFPENYRKDLKDMVEKDYNHPSVILYSIGNEVSEPAEEKGVALAKEMTELLHELDPDRPVTGGFNLMIIGNAAKGKQMYKEDGGLDNGGEEKISGMNSTMFNLITSLVGSGMNKAANSSKMDKAVSPVLDTVDIAGYNYASGRYRMEGKLHPDRLIFGSETFPQDLAKNWKIVEELPYLAGDFMWTAWDYIGEAGIGAWSWENDAKGFNKPYPWLLADTGAFDILGNPNGEALWAKAIWQRGTKPLIAVRPANHAGERLVKASWRGTNGIPSWSFCGCEGNKTVVEVYTKAPKAALYLDGKSVGKKKTVNCRAQFAMKYKPGVLTALALDENGKELSRTKLESAKTASVKLHTDHTEVRPGEIVYVDVNLQDFKGIVESNQDTRLTIRAEGAELLGFGSANPRTEERYDSGSFTTYYGRAQAVLRITETGEIKITVSGDDAGTDALILQSRSCSWLSGSCGLTPPVSDTSV